MDKTTREKQQEIQDTIAIHLKTPEPAKIEAIFAFIKNAKDATFQIPNKQQDILKEIYILNDNWSKSFINSTKIAALSVAQSIHFIFYNNIILKNGAKILGSDLYAVHNAFNMIGVGVDKDVLLEQLNSKVQDNDIDIIDQQKDILSFLSLLNTDDTIPKPVKNIILAAQYPQGYNYQEAGNDSKWVSQGYWYRNLDGQWHNIAKNEKDGNVPQDHWYDNITIKAMDIQATYQEYSKNVIGDSHLPTTLSFFS